MPYNHYNNDLPVPPPGFINWRAAFASIVDFLSQYEGAYQPQEQLVEFAPKMSWHLRDPAAYPVGCDDVKLIQVPYWKVAHYAAREQAQDDAACPPLPLHKLHELRNVFLSAPNNSDTRIDSETIVWLDRHIKQAHELNKRR